MTSHSIHTAVSFAVALTLSFIAAIARAQPAGAIPADAELVVRGETVHTMNGQPLQNGWVAVAKGKIVAVGSGDAPAPADARVISGKVVTPGLIDARTIIGLQGYQNEPRENDVLERSASMQPELRAIDAFNGRERLLEWVRGFGVTTIHTAFAPGALVTGQSLVIKTSGPTIDDGLLKADAMLCVTLGDEGMTREDGGRAPGTRAKQIAMLRQELIKAQESMAKKRPGVAQPTADATSNSDEADELGKSRGGRDLRGEVYERVLSKELPVLVYALRAQDIVAALKLADEFGFKLVLDGAAESYLLIEQIKNAGVPVIVHATMKRAGGESENLSFETAAKLKAAGIPLAMQSGFEAYVPKTRVVLLETAQAVANGFKFEDALAALTIDGATLLGINQRVGSIEPGKDADLALFDGDPFEYTTRCVGTVIDGIVVHDRPR